MQVKLLLLTILLILFASVLWCSVAEEILLSPDVMIYQCQGNLFLMDANTGKQVAVETENPCQYLTWSANGRSLYYQNLESLGENSENGYDLRYTLNIYEKDLATGNETTLLTTTVDGPDMFNIELLRGPGDSLYVNGVINDYGNYTMEDGITVSSNMAYRFGVGAFNLKTHSWAVLPRIDDDPAPYSDKKEMDVRTEGFGIINKKVNDTSVNNTPMPHYELYINKAAKGQPANYVKLTTFDKKDDLHFLYNYKIKFSLSPDKKNVIYSYRYRISDPNGFFGLTYVSSLDGLHKQELYDSWALDTPLVSNWTKDGRIVFVQPDPEDEFIYYVSILGKDWKVKQLTSALDSVPYIYYRQ
jgi:hypothetical protein